MDYKHCRLFDKNYIKQWSFHMNWDDYDRSNKYDIEFYSNRNLYELNKELFAPDLSTIRTGWKARYEINSDGKPESVKVLDALGNLFYYYEFTYTKKWLKSSTINKTPLLLVVIQRALRKAKK